jgi:phenylpropionate dioxygenase-like ring-hydroxylating dioxygenase large terminal subunit
VVRALANTDPALRHCWHPVARSGEVTDQPSGVMLLGEPCEDPGVVAGLRPLVQTRRLTYQLCAPFHLRLRIDFVDAGGSNVIGFFIQPETDQTCRLFTTLWRDDLDGDEARMAEAVDFELEVLREDLRIQEGYRELVLPLDPTAEVHTRADRATLELRRVLGDLVAAVEAGPR